MKIFLFILALLLLSTLFYFFYLGYKSQSGTANGVLSSKLTPCANKPNCICTEFVDDKSHYIDAIKYSGESIESIADAIRASGGIIINTQSSYIAATYTSNIFRYVDDFEVRIDSENQLIHVRSASRVGHSDMGANLKRINEFNNKLRQRSATRAQ